MSNVRTGSVLNRIIVILVITILLACGVLLKVEKTLIHKTEKLKPEYHFYVIGKNKVDSFWKDLQEGIEEKSEEMGVVIEYNAPRFTNAEEALKYIEIAILSNVDGIILHAFDTEGYRQAISNAEEKGIPVVLVENEVANAEFDTFVGADSKNVGKAAGELMKDALKESGNILIIDEQREEHDRSSYGKLAGFKKALEGNENISIKKIEASKHGALTAEEIVENALKERIKIDGIYTTNSADTLGAAQAIIDSNKVGEIQIIGYGDTEEIRRLIDQGVVFGTVVGNSRTIGEKSVETMIDIKKGQRTQKFVDTDYRIIK